MYNAAKSYKQSFCGWPVLMPLGRQLKDHWDGKSPTKGTNYKFVTKTHIDKAKTEDRFIWSPGNYGEATGLGLLCSQDTGYCIIDWDIATPDDTNVICGVNFKKCFDYKEKYQTPTYRTPSGGYQSIFKWNAKVHQSQVSIKVWDTKIQGLPENKFKILAIDVRANNGIGVIPPSTYHVKHNKFKAKFNGMI